MIAMLLTAVMVTSIFSVALVTKGGGGRNDRKLILQNAIKQLSIQLRSYVTSDSSAASGLPGPGNSGSSTNGWGLSGTTGAGGAAVLDACPGGGSTCWALLGGSHSLTGYLPTTLEAAPYNALVMYWVEGSTMPSVSITASWSEL